MTTLRRFRMADLFSFNNVNLDPFTETVRDRVMDGSKLEPNEYHLCLQSHHTVHVCVDICSRHVPVSHALLYAVPGHVARVLYRCRVAER